MNALTVGSVDQPPNIGRSMCGQNSVTFLTYFFNPQMEPYNNSYEEKAEIKGEGSLTKAYSLVTMRISEILWYRIPFLSSS